MERRAPDDEDKSRASGAPRDAGEHVVKPPLAERESEPPPSHAGEHHRSNIAAKAFRGLFWMASTGLGSRIVSLVSTLLLTRFVVPEEYGEVQNTFVVIWMIDLICQLGFPMYIAGRADISKKHIDHAIFYYHLVGFFGLGLCLVIAKPLGPMFGAPHMHLYMPGFVVAHLFQRIGTIPDRLLVRQLRFRASSVIRALGEIVYAVTSLGLAVFGHRFRFQVGGLDFVFVGGFAIVWGGIARGVFRTIACLFLVHVREWFAFIKPNRETTRDVFAFGIPITLAGLGSLGARRWDNLVLGHLYGPGVAGIYNFAYNLADVPPSVVGESLGDILAPSFAKVDPKDRPKELVRWISISALVCFPLGVGLSSVAHSLSWMFNERWLPAVPMIVLLGSLSLTRPVLGTAFAYLQVLGKTRTLMVLEWLKAIGITIFIFVVGHSLRAFSPDADTHWGPLFACVAVGVVQALSTLSYQIAAARAGGFPARHVIMPVFRPLLACVPMVAGVLLVRLAIGPVQSKSHLILRLLAEIAAGGLVFVGSAWMIARSASRELLGLVKTAMLRRRG
ncbi:MAG: oligosaccharide flippase family protein [Polyangiaceae bacterium]|nr:oligosaccharide flippase family protein [Polyangiaceae bacterium]